MLFSTSFRARGPRCRATFALPISTVLLLGWFCQCPAPAAGGESGVAAARKDLAGGGLSQSVDQFLDRVESPVPPRKTRQVRHTRNPEGQIIGLRLKGTALQNADFPLIGRMPQLQILDLSGTNVTDDDLRHLSGLKGLRELILWETGIGDAGAAHLAAMQGLCRLNLGRTNLTDAGLRHLGGLDDLRHLVLTGNSISDVGLKHLKALNRLQGLKLSSTGITDDGLRELVGLKDLRGLTLDRTKVTDAGLKALAALPALKWMSSPESVAVELARRLQNNDYEAIDEMLAVGLGASSMPQRGQFLQKGLEVIPQTGADRERGWRRFRLEMHWIEDPAKVPQTFYAVFAVERATVSLHDIGINGR